MHSYDVRKRALLAVAKLSIFAGAVGCGGSAVLEADPSAAYDPGPGVDADGSTSSGTPTIPIAERPSAEACFDPWVNTDACCNEVLTQAFSDDQLFSDPSLLTDEQHACCDLVTMTLVQWSSADPPPFDWSLESNCCAVDPAINPICTAWGPPMPPAMPRRRALNAENAEVLA